MVKKSINVNMKYDNAYFEDADMWFVERSNNILCQLDIDKNKLIYHGIIPYGSIGDAYRRHPQCVKYNNYIICLPDRGKSFVVYNLENKEFQECMIDMKGCMRVGICNFWKINGNLWCVSSGMNSIIEFNPVLCEVVGYYAVFNDSINELGCDACAIGTTILCTSVTSRMLAFFDVNDKKVRYYEAKSDEPGYNSISAYDTKIYLSGFSRHIYVFDRITYETCQIELNRDNFHIFDDKHNEIQDFSNHPIFRKSFMTESFVVFLPWYMPDSMADSIVFFCQKTGKIKFYNILQDIYKKRVTYNSQYLYIMQIINNKEIEIYLDGEPLHYLNVQDGSVSHATTEVKDTIYGNIFSDKHLLISETGKNDLREYIRAIAESN